MKMQEMSEQSGNKSEQPEVEAIDLIGLMVLEIMKTPAFNKILNVLLRDIMAEWAGSNIVKKKVSQSLATMTSGMISAKPENQKKVSDSELFGYIGKLFTLVSINIGKILRENPTYYADRIQGSFEDLLANTDFGELKEMVDESETCVLAAAGMLSNSLWDYPGKLACMEAMNFTLINIAIKSFNAMLKPLDNAAPETLSDLLFAVVRIIEGQEIGVLINALAEMLRKIHTGSLFLGETNRSLLQIDFTDTMRDILSTLDPELVCKAKVALAENSEAVANAKVDASLDNPGLFMQTTASYSQIKNPKIRAFSKKISVFENLPQEEIAENVLEGIADLDTQEIGEIVNMLLRVLNNVHQYNQQAVFNVISTIVASIDIDELGSAAQWVMKDSVEALRPVARTIMPTLILGLNELLKPMPGEDTNDMDQALSQLRETLGGNGGKR